MPTRCVILAILCLLAAACSDRSAPPAPAPPPEAHGQQAVGPVPNSHATEPTIELAGEITAADGSIPGPAEILAGPGDNPRSDRTFKTQSDKHNRFTLTFKEPGPHWVAVRCEGYAVWQQIIDLKPGGATVSVVLDRGVEFGATLQPADASATDLYARLVPQFEGVTVPDRPRARFTTLTATPADGKTLRVPHVPPGKYELHIGGKNITPRRMNLDVAATPLDLGAVKVRAPGSIRGQVFDPNTHKPWPHAEGLVMHPLLEPIEYIRFTTDADGKFTVPGVPAGSVDVKFEYPIAPSITANLIGTADVSENAVTEVHFPAAGN